MKIATLCIVLTTALLSGCGDSESNSSSNDNPTIDSKYDFTLYDDFQSNSIDDEKWEETINSSGSLSVQNGALKAVAI